MKNDAISNGTEIDIFTRILHLGLVFFGLLALATGDVADDYKKVGGLGFIVHGWIGIGITFFISLRFMYGIWGSANARFTNWIPYNGERLKLVLEDIVGFVQRRLPDRQPHQGVAGLVEILGLLLFLLLAATGVFMFFAIEPGHKVQGTTHIIKEMHGIGEILLPLYFLGHGGAVLLHAMAGKHLWRKMIFLKEN